jgi:predicted metalloprotease with PDZ domain
VLIPQPQGNEPFGNVARGGGASVLLLVPARFDAPSLMRDWVLPHELSHLLLPFLAREDAWLSEGFATYYQEILRARGGAIDAGEALSNLARSLRSARHEGTGRTLCEESRAMHGTHAYRAVYWGGAGHWLKLDLALREASAGELGIDSLLTQLRSEARLTPPYSARELLARLDQLSHTQLFSALLAACEREPFPDVEPALEALGVTSDDHLRDEPTLKARRDGLFAPQAPK